MEALNPDERMREYRFQASEESVDALRRLRASWSGVLATARLVTVALADDTFVRIWVGAADVEGVFDAFRFVAITAPTLSDLDARMAADDETDDIPKSELPTASTPFDAASDLSLPDNDVVLFTGVSWTESAHADAPLHGGQGTMHLSGHPGQLSESAALVCITTDALVVAATTGEGMLIRTGLAPYSLQTTRDADAIAAFLRERAYTEE